MRPWHPSAGYALFPTRPPHPPPGVDGRGESGRIAGFRFPDCARVTDCWTRPAPLPCLRSARRDAVARRQGGARSGSATPESSGSPAALRRGRGKLRAARTAWRLVSGLPHRGPATATEGPGVGGTPRTAGTGRGRGSGCVPSASAVGRKWQAPPWHGARGGKKPRGAGADRMRLDKPGGLPRDGHEQCEPHAGREMTVLPVGSFDRCYRREGATTLSRVGPVHCRAPRRAGMAGRLVRAAPGPGSDRRRDPERPSQPVAVTVAAPGSGPSEGIEASGFGGRDSAARITGLTESGGQPSRHGRPPPCGRRPAARADEGGGVAAALPETRPNGRDGSVPSSGRAATSERRGSTPEWRLRDASRKGGGGTGRRLAAAVGPARAIVPEPACALPSAALGPIHDGGANSAPSATVASPAPGSLREPAAPRRDLERSH
ncbi:hypothetical protein HRbin40_01767 [bacterium HR40]|nr:hypothetical protein HRbin40_01767 [bacterium HR40]